MQNIAGNKMFAHLYRIVGEHKPITADIFLNNFCNNRCPYCTYGRWELDPGARAMSFKGFCKYATRLLEMGVEGFILTGGGEPTLTPDFDRITEWMDEKGLHYGINTNFNVLRLPRPDYLKVSLDGWDEDSYEHRRGVRKYAVVVKNIQDYAVWKRQHSPRTSLGIQCVVTSPDDVMRFYEANCDLLVDYIAFRPIESTGGKAYALDMAKEQAARTMEAVKELAANDSRVVLNFKWELLDRQEDSCTASWAQIALNERGEVMYCCHKPYQIIGHILDPDILEKKNRATTDMAGCDIPCRMTGPNMYVHEMLLAGRKDACFI